MQKTLGREISFQGKTLFSGEEVAVRLLPAETGSGIHFRRVDLTECIEIPAKTEYVQEAVRTTKLGIGSTSVQTVEHLMAALFALNVDNLIIEMSGAEMPIFDGSARFFVEAIQQAGVVDQEVKAEVYTLDEPCHFVVGDAHLIALPATDLRVSYTLHDPSSPHLGSQFFSATVTPECFCREMASCRTFARYQEVAPLIEKGILKGTTLEHGVVVDGEKILNPEGVRFRDEMARHKALDLIGDIGLLGVRLEVHLVGAKTGHAANHALARLLRSKLRKKWTS